MLKNIKNVYIVGIKGVAMAGLAVIFQKLGKNVQGSDNNETFITENILQNNQIQVLQGFKKENIPDKCDLIIYSAAHGGLSNPEVQEGLRRNIKVISQAEIIGDLMKRFKTSVAVAGCHGKTTTSSLLSYLMVKLGKKPTYLVGAPEFSGLQGADFGSLDYFVLEADEYGVNPPTDKRVKLSFLNPTHIIATNIDFDHPDVYKNLEEVKSVFLNFFKKINSFAGYSPRLFYCRDDKNLCEVVRQLPEQLTSSFGFSSDADFQIVNLETNPGSSKFSLIFKGQNLGHFYIPLFGKKNISNTAGVILFLLTQGIPVSEIKQILPNFQGVKRRFEQLAFVSNVYLFDDYAHHPAEITATIHSARLRFPDKRIIVIFQPHTFSRTKILRHEFAQALSLADVSYILPIFPSARESNDASITSNTIADIAKLNLGSLVKAVQNNEEALEELKKKLKPQDVIFLMGAGDIYKLKNGIINIIKGL